MKIIITETQYSNLFEEDQDLFPNRREPKWTPEKITKEASKYNTKGEFRIGSFNAYQSARKIPNFLYTLFPNDTKPVKLTPELVRQEASKYSTRKSFEVNNLPAYGFAWRNKMLDDLFPNPRESKWSPDRITQEASKYKTKGEFRLESPSAYIYATKIPDLLHTLFPNETKRVKWTPELVRQEASKYSTRSEFNRNSPSAYQFAWKNGMIKKLNESQYKKLIKEQEERNPSECAVQYVHFLFEKSIMGEDDYGDYTVIDGGDLWYWNENKLPQPDDLEAYERFLKYCKELKDDDTPGYEECDNVSFEELKPFLEELYHEELSKRTSSNNNGVGNVVDTSKDNLYLKRRLSTIEDLIDKYVNEVEEEGTLFSDEFEFASNIISWVIDDFTNYDYENNNFDELEELIKDNFGEYILSQYTEPDDEDFNF